MYFGIYRYGKRNTEKGTRTCYASFNRDMENIKKYLKAHKHEKYTFEIQKWTFDIAYIVRLYPEVE